MAAEVSAHRKSHLSIIKLRWKPSPLLHSGLPSFCSAATFYALLLITVPGILALLYCGSELMTHRTPDQRPDRRYGVLAMATGFILFFCFCYALAHPFVI